MSQDDLGSRIGGYIECGAGQVVGCLCIVSSQKVTILNSLYFSSFIVFNH